MRKKEHKDILINYFCNIIDSETVAEFYGKELDVVLDILMEYQRSWDEVRIEDVEGLVLGSVEDRELDKIIENCHNDIMNV